MAKTIQSIVERAKALMKKTEPRSITPTEVGQLHVDTLENVDQNASDIITVAKATGTLMANISDLSLQVSGKVGKSGSVENVHQVVECRFDDSNAPTNIITEGTVTKYGDHWHIVCHNINNHAISIGGCVSGHKYAMSMDGATQRYYKWVNNTIIYHGNGLNESSYQIATERSILWSVVEAKADASYMVMSNQWGGSNDASGNDVDIYGLSCYDLTEMFGSGNEPTTAQAFAEALGYASIDDVPYIPFSASAITMPSVDSIGGLMAGKLLANEICLGEYTLRCNGSSLVAVDSSGNETTLLGGASTMSLDDDTTTE